MLLSQPKRTYAEDILLLNEGARGRVVEVPVGKHVPAGSAQTMGGFLMPVALAEGSSEMGRLETRPLPILQARARSASLASVRAAVRARARQRRPPRIARCPPSQAIQRGFGAAYDVLAPSTHADGAPTGAEEALRVFPDALVDFASAS